MRLDFKDAGHSRIQPVCSAPQERGDNAARNPSPCAFGLENAEQCIDGHGHERENPDVASKFEQLKSIVSSVRTMRSELTVPPSKKVRVMLKLSDSLDAKFFESNKALMSLLMSASGVEFVSAKPAESGCVMVAGTGFEAYVSVKDVIDVPQEIAKLKAEIAKNEKILEKSLKKLGNPQFMEKAAPEAIAKEQAAKEELTSLIDKKKEYLAELA